MSGYNQHHTPTLPGSTAREEQAVSNSPSCALTRGYQQLTFDQAAMEDTNRYLPPCNTPTTPAAAGYDAQDRFGNDGRVSRSLAITSPTHQYQDGISFQGRRSAYLDPTNCGYNAVETRGTGCYGDAGSLATASAVTTSHAPPHTAMPMGLDSYSRHDEQNRLIDRHGHCLDDVQALQPQSLAAFVPSSLNETVQQQRGNAPSQNLTTPSFDSELFFNPADMALFDDNMNPLDPPPGWPSSAFYDVANELGAYNQQYGSSYAQHPLSSPSDPVRAAATQRDGSRPLPQQRQQQVSGLDVNASSVQPVAHQSLSAPSSYRHCQPCQSPARWIGSLSRPTTTYAGT
jgi:hypothetical protein